LIGRDRLPQARAQLEEVCDRLQSPTPENLNLTVEILERAANVLHEPQEAWDPSLLAEAKSIRALNARAHLLLEGAAKYHSGWINRISGIASGYTPAGGPAALVHSARLQIRA
jgi:hypothetical protein